MEFQRIAKVMTTEELRWELDKNKKRSIEIKKELEKRAQK